MNDNVGNSRSPKGPSHFVKAKILSDCLMISSDKNVEMEQRVNISNHEIDGCKDEILPERVAMGHFSLTGCKKDDVDTLKQPSSVISTVKNSVLQGDIHAEGTSRVMSGRNGLDHSEDSEASAPFMVGDPSLKKSSVKSDVGSDSGQPSQTKGDEVVDGKMDGYPPCVGELEVKSSVQTTCHDKQCKSESSSSNSAQVTLPASSKDSCQEMSFCKSSYETITPRAVDTSTCTNFKLEQPAFRSLVPDMAVQVPKYQLNATMVLSEEQCNENKASGPIDNTRTRVSGKVLGLTPVNRWVSGIKINHLKSDLPKKKTTGCYNKSRSETCYDLGGDDALEVAWKVAKEVEQEVEASGSSSSIPGRSSKVVHLSSVDSAGSHREDCLTETGSIHHKCDESDSFCSIKETMDLKLVTKKELLSLEVKEPVQGIVPGTSDGCQKQGSSSFAIEVEGRAASNQTSHVFGIDLNEDILENEEEFPQKSIKETVSLLENVSKPIPVLAKSGIPLCLPVPQFQNEWDVGGWRGSAATSAFKPTSCSESCNRNALSMNDTICSSNYSQVKGIDLNVAAAGAEFDVELLSKKPMTAISGNYSKESSVEVNSRRARMLDIDLNCVSENGDSSRQLSPPACVRDFDLNDNLPSADACIVPYRTYVGSLGLRNGNFNDRAVSSVEYSRQSDFKTIRSSCSQDLSSREGFSHSHDKTFMVAATNMLPSNEQLQRMAALQHKVAFSPSPPHAFLYNNGFCIDPNNSLSPNVYPPSFLPYMTDPRATTVVPQYFGSGAVPVFPMAPHLMGVPHGSAPNDIAFIRPTFDLNIGANSLENGSRGMNARQLSIPASDATMEEQMKSFQQVGLTAIPMKRREPDGGWDSHQLFFRHATSWR
uniref:uncharacterized protein LOC105351606 n=1 Tax=Fragaria vesca subsp. vesca TaxID=101020 RepID=UPI0005CAFED4|nr:PREDICTED: uncharacterized protein LOC105351606 [Fragaria vesca subsp. vesca]XP_011464803.1 PREDICTED: uncharacterized protein LOC105351606 [Fragaria vesca subsp. vesca]